MSHVNVFVVICSTVVPTTIDLSTGALHTISHRHKCPRTETCSLIKNLKPKFIQNLYGNQYLSNAYFALLLFANSPSANLFHLGGNCAHATKFACRWVVAAMLLTGANSTNSFW